MLRDGWLSIESYLNERFEPLVERKRRSLDGDLGRPRSPWTNRRAEAYVAALDAAGVKAEQRRLRRFNTLPSAVVWYGETVRGPEGFDNAEHYLSLLESRESELRHAA